MINEKVKQWFYDRNMQELDGNIQMLKLYEELGELSEAILKDDVWGILDAIGDMGVVLQGILIMKGLDTSPEPTRYEGIVLTNTLALTTLNIGSMAVFGDYKHLCDTIAGLLNNIAKKYDSTYYECLEMAYDEIKDRKGKVINGVFVKEEDLDGSFNETT